MSTPSECSLLASSATSMPDWVSWAPCSCSKRGAEGSVPPLALLLIDTCVLLSAWLMRILLPISRPDKAEGNKVADSAVQCDSDRDRVLACSCTVTPGTDRDSDPYRLNLVWAGVVFCFCTQIWVGEATQTPGRVV